MLLRTRIFDLCYGHYQNLSELARTMGISVSQIYRVREGKRSINQAFIVGAVKAFPGYRLDDLFCIVPESPSEDIFRTNVNIRHQYLVQKYGRLSLHQEPGEPEIRVGVRGVSPEGEVAGKRA